MSLDPLPNLKWTVSLVASVGVLVVVDELSEAPITLPVEGSVPTPHLNVEAGVPDPKIDGEDWFVVQLEPPNLKELDVEPKVDVVVVEEVCSGGLKDF